jgi:ferredoxin
LPPFIDEAHDPDPDGRPADRDRQAGRNGQPGRIEIEIELKTDACMAHGICMELAPAYFIPDEDGYVSLAPDARQSGESAQLHLAAASCPMRVITVRPSHSTSSEDLHR